MILLMTKIIEINQYLLKIQLAKVGALLLRHSKWASSFLTARQLKQRHEKQMCGR